MTARSQVFSFIDGNGNHLLEYGEINTAIKDKYFVFFDRYLRDDEEFMRVNHPMLSSFHAMLTIRHAL